MGGFEISPREAARVEELARALLDYLIAYHYAIEAKLFYLLAIEAGKPLYVRAYWLPHNF
jgi:hypothetical protein